MGLKKHLLVSFGFLLSIHPLFGQSTSEDSLNVGLNKPSTTIGGYGNAFYERDFDRKTSVADLQRVVLFVGHQFNAKISFFSELEVEDAKVTGGEPGGEVSFEQSYLKFNLDPNHYFVAGLFLPRIGILNENHLPTTFNGNQRTEVETVIIPSTWRELGIGFYGNINSLPVNYSVGIVNGLNSSAFQHGSGILEGRFEGRNASANNLAVTGSLQFVKNDFKAQVSAYYGGSVGLSPRKADSLQLNSGIFGTPVALGEADIQYSLKGFSLRVLATYLAIPDASDINRAYANNTPESEYGAYAEVSYNFFEKNNKGRQLIPFVRYEKLNINSTIPSNGIIDSTLNQQDLITGIGYWPIADVVIKADVRFQNTGPQNPLLIINPSPTALPYRVNDTFFDLGIGFSF